jgi:hypothetical protein
MEEPDKRMSIGIWDRFAAVTINEGRSARK